MGQPKRFYSQLKGVGNADVATIDPTTANLTASYRFDSIPARIDRDYTYLEKLRLWLEFTVTQAGGAGSIIRPDQLYRQLSSFQLQSDDLGVLYGPGDLNGPALGNIAQVVGNGYRTPYPYRDDIAGANGATNVVLPIDIPIAQRCMWKGHQTGIWTGHFKKGGQLDVNLAAANALVPVSAGVSTGPIKCRVEAIWTSEPEARVPVIWTWKMRNTPTGDVKHTIKNLCQGKGIAGSSGLGKVAFLAFLSNNNGLGGSTTIDQITRVNPTDRRQPTHNMGAPFYGPASFLADFISETREKNIYGSPAAGGYPLAMGTAVEGQPNVASALFLPFFWPDPTTDGQMVSKLQEVSGEYYIELDYLGGAAPGSAAWWLSLETSYLTEQQKDFLQGDRMGLPVSQYVRYAKVRGLSHPGDIYGQAEQQRKLRGIPEKIRQRAA